MNLLSCCRLSKEQSKSIREGIAQTNRALSKLHSKTFSFMLKNLSRKTPSSKQKLIEQEVIKLGNGEVMVLGNGGKVQGQLFTYSEIVVATDDFNDDLLLGEGGFGKVYKGHIKGIDNAVAIKQLDRDGRQGSREFFSEVLMLSLVQHPNLVNLIGYCVDVDQRILAYEYMSSGSLEDHLFNLGPEEVPLDWNTRMKIALGAARGLEYLHDVANPPIIYRDFKASNILLDSDLDPKLSDFGLAKLGPTGHKLHVTTRVMGTYGYCAPEYQQTGKLSTKSDVYSFGVVFLEIIAGRRVIDTSRPTEEHNLIYWAEPLFRDKAKFTAMADPLLQGNYPVKNLYQALAIAAMCLQEEADTRPLMADVVSALEFLVQPRGDDQPSLVGASTINADRIGSLKTGSFEEGR